MGVRIDYEFMTQSRIGAKAHEKQVVCCALQDTHNDYHLSIKWNMIE